MNLVIVESPTKAKTITKFLGKDYKIESSFGHIRDLPKSELGVDVEKNFEPRYIIPRKTQKNVTALKKLAAKADEIILATDEDREGEAIAWHLKHALKLEDKQIKRIVFHEITEEAIKEALKNPRSIDDNLVDAQQARRVLDRLVGYKLSPFLWKKVAKGLSAGRVQSVALRLVVEREREIQKFKPEEYWSMTALLNQISNKDKEITAKLNKIDGQVIDKMEIKNEKQAKEIFNNLDKASYIVGEVKKKESFKNPPKPFTTSTLQQTANRWYGYSAKQTMMFAQRLYEGIEVKGEGSVGLITYMRTDSLNLSDKFLTEAKEYLSSALGKNYALAKPNKFKTKSKGAQEAHEAIRPTDVNRTPESLQGLLDPKQHKLYELIWRRAVASQMPKAVFDSTSLNINAKTKEEKIKYQFRANGQVMKFDGYLNIYPEQSQEFQLPEVKEGEELSLKELVKEQHFTKPPARYSDAGLVKELEKHGIGRPSTYAPTISTIETRNYVQRDENKKLFPTDIAFVVNDLLVKHFVDIVDYKFTAQMEESLDEVAHGKKQWQPLIKDFYEPFEKNLEIKNNELNKQDIMPEEKSDVKCDKCGAPMIIKTGRYGKFLACSGFPDCKNIKGMDGAGKPEAKDDKIKELEKKYNGEKCDKCGSEMVIKKGRFGPFLACSGYPKCKNIKNIAENNNSTGVKCPVCKKGEVVAKHSKRGTFYACDQYPDCKTAFWGKPTGDNCPECNNLLLEDKQGNVKCASKDCGYQK